ncbi:sigma-70 family RNA polymerase sigma factor [Paenibacillus soyae]|uniref:Sigma-70 family RNA polymerase sigma factor n=1 Tax=Paenibacillus soyae TaxID=2969249 RepID=A0A9X2MM15_9BACL|nr:sigma-70 family RNA polymerase sigma factor [Paenibacillus soyae]
MWDYFKALAPGYDKDAVLRELMEAFGNDVWRFAYFLTRRKEAADDISQEVFLSAYKNMYAFRGECTVKSWLLTITRNKSIHYLQSAFIRRVTLTDRITRSGGISPAAEQMAFDRMENKALWDTVMKLPRKYEATEELTHFQVNNKVQTKRRCPHPYIGMGIFFL